MKSIRNIFNPKQKNGSHNGKGNGSYYSKDIDFNMQAAENLNKRTIRILLLGPGDSGKTTIVKQMKKIHETLDDEDIKIMGPYIQDAVMVYIKKLCQQSKELHDKFDEKTQIEEKNEALRQEMLNLRAPYTLNEELAGKIATLWADVCTLLLLYILSLCT